MEGVVILKNWEYDNLRKKENLWDAVTYNFAEVVVKGYTKND